MQVNDNSGKNNTVVFTPNTTEQNLEFSISNNENLFNILSDNMYSNKPLACIREVICNAWDSHIASGLTDTSIKITCKNNELFEVKDFGEGIPPEKLNKIYFTYGESTKSHDGKQTGGFGLGSKAPFAVTNTFTVTNCYQGKKTVIVINKEPNQKPKPINIVTSDTDETGLTVSVPNTSVTSREVLEFLEFSGINCKFNGRQQDIFTFEEYADVSPLKFNYSIDTFIKYGNVAYPLNKEMLPYSTRKILNAVNTVHNKTLIQAEPHSISITPSREELAYTPKTINYLDKLIRKLWYKHYVPLKKNYINKFKKLNTIEDIVKSNLYSLVNLDSLNGKLVKDFSNKIKFINKIYINSNVDLPQRIYDKSLRKLLEKKLSNYTLKYIRKAYPNKIERYPYFYNIITNKVLITNSSAKNIPDDVINFNDSSEIIYIYTGKNNFKTAKKDFEKLGFSVTIYEKPKVKKVRNSVINKTKYQFKYAILPDGTEIVNDKEKVNDYILANLDKTYTLYPWRLYTDTSRNTYKSLFKSCSKLDAVILHNTDDVRSTSVEKFKREVTNVIGLTDYINKNFDKLVNKKELFLYDALYEKKFWNNNTLYKIQNYPDYFKKDATFNLIKEFNKKPLDYYKELHALLYYHRSLDEYFKDVKHLFDHNWWKTAIDIDKVISGLKDNIYSKDFRSFAINILENYPYNKPKEVNNED